MSGGTEARRGGSPSTRLPLCACIPRNAHRFFSRCLVYFCCLYCKANGLRREGCLPPSPGVCAVDAAVRRRVFPLLRPFPFRRVEPPPCW